ncbi:MAG: hypothetical protein H6810_06835 [Phycisphaeraceae bacterium]|nr:MAG: hypothetical protein H6810_06835 [Phycisphaeraceae bacterium]
MTTKTNNSGRDAHAGPADPVESTPGRPVARGALWAMAFVLLGLILLRAAGVAPDSTAHADMTAASGTYTAMTTRSGTDELLYVVDDRNEQLQVYRVRQANSVELVAREDLRQMFTAARAAALGAPPGRP